MDAYDVIRFSQYESDSADDDLLLFAAPAEAIASWAGVPQHGWHLRMLFQRWVTPGRQQEVTSFWNYASTPSPGSGKKYILGPTALTVAVFGDPEIRGEKIVLDYELPFDLMDPGVDQLAATATVFVNRMVTRLTPTEKEIVDAVLRDPTTKLDDVSPNWVLQSLCAIAQAVTDASSFIEANNLSDTDVKELVGALEALCRPALVVDGQHRLYGAARADSDIWLPVVAMPNSPWTEGIYQFIVINEKAQRVDTSLLTDIFGSSLTPSEQKAIEVQLDKTGAKVQERIAAVIAARDPDSPFYELVKFALGGQSKGFVPTATVRQLIDGGGRGGRGWRSDEAFYKTYVAPTVPDQADWDSWTDGKWKEYWFGFWAEVRDYYNKAATTDLWTREQQTNLTKAVSLRLFQRLFMEKMVEAVEDVERTRETLLSVFKDEAKTNEALAGRVREVALPDTVDEFRKRVRSEFLDKGIPVRVFERPWVSSLDDQTGQQNLYEEFLKAYDATQRGTRYRAQNKDVFAVAED